MKTYIITGNTYPLKDEIKSSFTAKWDKLRKGWLVQTEEDTIKAFCLDNELEYLEVELELKGDDKDTPWNEICIYKKKEIKCIK